MAPEWDEWEEASGGIKGKVGKIEQISRHGDKERKEEGPVSCDNDSRGPERKRLASSLL